MGGGRMGGGKVGWGGWLGGLGGDIKMSSCGQGQSYLSVGCRGESQILEELALTRQAASGLIGRIYFILNKCL